MSRFFTEVQFDIPREEDLPRTTTTTWNKDIISQAEQTTLADIEQIKDGTSAFTAYAIDPGRHGFPAVNSLQAFVRAPNDKTLKNFEDAANSTFGSRVGKIFADRFRVAREVKDV